LAKRGEPRTPDELSSHDCLVFSDSPGSAEWRFADGMKTGRKFRISGRLWMNSLEALISAAREGAGIVHVPSWQVQSDLTSGRLQRLLLDHEPAPTPLHLMLQPSRLASPKIRAFVDFLVEQWGKIDTFRTPSVGR
jgi:DNA-binding transcriptional LysR family regulator